MARGTARAPGGSLRLGSAALLTGCPVEGQWAGPAGLPPGTGRIHAQLDADCQVRQDPAAAAAVPDGHRRRLPGKGGGHAVAIPAGARDADAVARGTVKFFKPGKGCGVIVSADLPDGLDAWVHFSVIEMGGYRVLNAGDEVEFEYELAQQVRFRFVVTRVRKI